MTTVEYFRQQNIAYNDLKEIPEDLVQRTARFVEELDLSYNRISYPFKNVSFDCSFHFITVQFLAWFCKNLKKVKGLLCVFFEKIVYILQNKVKCSQNISGTYTICMRIVHFFFFRKFWLSTTYFFCMFAKHDIYFSGILMRKLTW